MQIAYFSNQFAVRQGHGVARYAHRLFEAIRRVHPHFRVIPVASWSNHDAEGIRRLKDRFGLHLLPWGRRLTPLAWTFLDWPHIEHWMGEPIDVVHAVALGFPLSTRKPLVVTIHDMGPLMHPEFFSMDRPWLTKLSLNRALKRADAIISVSRATANDLEAYTGRRLGDRLRIVHEGVSSRFFEEPNFDSITVLADLPGPGVPFLLAAGQISPRKNIARLIQAVAVLGDVIPHHLVLVGGCGWDSDDAQKAMRTTIVSDRIHNIGYVSDEQLHALYAAASVYVHPSLFEGFGLTVLEAMAAGCPVVTSKDGALAEVAGNDALLVDPYDVGSIAEAIQALCTDAALAERLTARGRARASDFTWERCAQQVSAIYQDVM